MCGASTSRGGEADVTDSLDQEYWQAAFDERAGILEYDENMHRRKAEAVARQWVLEVGGSLKGLRTERRAA